MNLSDVRDRVGNVAKYGKFARLSTALILCFSASAVVAAEPKPAASLPEKLTELPAPTGVKVTTSQPLVFAPLVELATGPLPEYLQGASVFTRPIAKYAKDRSAGEIKIEVRETGTFFLADSKGYDGAVAADEVWVDETFRDESWVSLTHVRLFNADTKRAEPCTLYFRTCKAGETITIRTHLYQPPLLIVPAADAKLPDLVALEPDPTKSELFQYEVVRSKAASLLDNGRFDELEAWVDGYLQTAAHFPSGHPKFTEVVYPFSAPLGGQTIVKFDRRWELMEEWIRRKPQSGAARVILGASLNRFAYHLGVRTTKPGAKDRVEEVKRRSLEVLYEAEQMRVPTADVFYWMYCAVSTKRSWQDELALEYLNKAIDSGLWCPAVVQNTFGNRIAGLALSPTESQREEVEATRRQLDSMVERTRAKFGEAMYAAVVAETIRGLIDAPFTSGVMEWPRLKKGFEDLERLFPGSARNRQSFFRHACAAGDRETAHALLEQLGDFKFEDEELGFDGDELKYHRAWAALDVPAGEQRELLESPGACIIGLGCIDDGRNVLLIDNRSRIWMRDAAGGPKKFLCRTASYPDAAAVAADGRHAVIASPYGDLGILDATAKNRIVSFPNGRAVRVAISREGRRIAAAGNDRTVVVYNLNEERPKSYPLQELHTRGVSMTAFADDDRAVVTAGGDGKIIVCDAATGAVRKSWQADPKRGIVTGLVAPDGKQILTITTDNRLQLWSLDGEKLRELIVKEPQPSRAAMSIDGKYLAVGTGDNGRTQPEEIRIYAAADWRLLTTLRGHKGIIVALAFSPDGRTLYSASRDLTVRTWDVPTN